MRLIGTCCGETDAFEGEYENDGFIELDALVCLVRQNPCLLLDNHNTTDYIVEGKSLNSFVYTPTFLNSLFRSFSRR